MCKDINKRQLVGVIIFIVFVLFVLSYMSYVFEKNSLNNSVDYKPINENNVKEEVICQTDKCKFDNAQLNMTESMCFNIADENLRVSCTAAIKRSSLLEEVVLEDDISLCNNFKTESGINHCEDNYYIAKRFNDNDKSYCQSIKNEDIKNECLKES